VLTQACFCTATQPKQTTLVADAIRANAHRQRQVRFSNHLPDKPPTSHRRRCRTHCTRRISPPPLQFSPSLHYTTWFAYKTTACGARTHTISSQPRGAGLCIPPQRAGSSRPFPPTAHSQRRVTIHRPVMTQPSCVAACDYCETRERSLPRFLRCTTSAPYSLPMYNLPFQRSVSTPAFAASTLTVHSTPSFLSPYPSRCAALPQRTPTRRRRGACHTAQRHVSLLSLPFLSFLPARTSLLARSPPSPFGSPPLHFLHTGQGSAFIFILFSCLCFTHSVVSSVRRCSVTSSHYPRQPY
jgi:hypothetical protein